MQETARGFSLFEKALLSFWGKDTNVEQHRKVATAVQNAIQWYRVTYDKKNRPTTQTWLDHFFKKVDWTESSKEPEPVPSMSGMSKTAACFPSPTADDPSALPFPTSSPYSSQQLFFPVPSMPAPVCQLLYFIIVLFKVLYWRLKVFIFFFSCIIFMKSIINLLQYSTVDIKMVVLIVYLD